VVLCRRDTALVDLAHDRLAATAMA